MEGKLLFFLFGVCACRSCFLDSARVINWLDYTHRPVSSDQWPVSSGRRSPSGQHSYRRSGVVSPLSTLGQDLGMWPIYGWGHWSKDNSRTLFSAGLPGGHRSPGIVVYSVLTRSNCLLKIKWPVCGSMFTGVSSFPTRSGLRPSRGGKSSRLVPKYIYHDSWIYLTEFFLWVIKDF